MEEKITAWIARDKNNALYLYFYKPHKAPRGWWYMETVEIEKCKKIDNELYPQVQWEDEEPTKVEVTIKICE